MFPINFNFPYRKKDGSIITMQKALDGAGADLDLIDLDDVAITNPADGDGLIYDNTAHKWKNIPIISRILTLFNGWKKNGAYNLYQMNMSSQAISGVTFTKISEGTFSLNTNGTLASAVNVDINPAQLFPAGTYKFLGAPSGVTNLDFAYIYQKGGTWYTVADGDTFTTDGTETTGWVRVYLYVGCNLDGSEIFKPMITTDLNATYADYVPYAKTNRELTTDKFLDNSSSYTALDTTITTTFTTTADGLYLIWAKCNNATSTADVYLQNGSSPILLVLGVDVMASQLVYLKAGTTLYIRSDKGTYGVRGYYKA